MREDSKDFLFAGPSFVLAHDATFLVLPFADNVYVKLMYELGERWVGFKSVVHAVQARYARVGDARLPESAAIVRGAVMVDSRWSMEECLSVGVPSYGAVVPKERCDNGAEARAGQAQGNEILLASELEDSMQRLIGLEQMVKRTIAGAFEGAH
jgi:hypothetical protein